MVPKDASPVIKGTYTVQTTLGDFSHTRTT